MASILPQITVAATVDGVRHVISPSPLAMVEWERHYEQPIWSILDRNAQAEHMLRLCWLTLKVDGSYTDALPVFDDWVALVEQVEGITDDGGGDEADE